MLSPEQKAHFDTFGFLILRQAFTPEEIDKITSTAEEIWKEHRANSSSNDKGASFDEFVEQRPLMKNPTSDVSISLDQFIEQRPLLTSLLDDNRIHDTVEGLLSPGFVWSGSEGHVTFHRQHGWHPDRPGDEEEISYLRIKVMIYLDPLDKNSGCLRVIPGSHRLPLHAQIEPEDRHQYGEIVKPFGITGEEMPSFPFECNPGDVIFFNHSLWHGMFNGTKGRRYIALKFAARPTTDKHLASLRHYQKGIFEPSDALLKSDRPRIRQMVEDLPRLGAKKVPTFVPFRDDN